MADAIRVLDDQTANMIAAGEVVERPASVVKELLENSLDAGARRIAIQVLHGGLKQIRVADDGCGMSPRDARLAFMRHATSKIRSHEDLRSIRSFGFRGEALPSIAAVSRVELLTRTPGERAGTRVVIEGGRQLLAEESGCPEGTIVIVRDLFYNTPARLKQMRSRRAEFAQVSDVVGALAMANPEVSMRLDHDGKNALATPGTGLEEAFVSVFGWNRAADHIRLEHEREGVRVTGYVCKPHLATANRGNQMFFVNRRPVRSMVMRRALEEGFRTVLPAGRFPSGVLFLEMDPSELDVNVHPSKTEVRFLSEANVFAALTEAVWNAVRGLRWPEPRLKPSYAAPLVAEERSRFEPVVFEQATLETEPPAGIPALTPIGFVLGAYLLAEGPDGLYILDEHAAHERVSLELIEERWQEQVQLSQRLVQPELVDLSPAEFIAFQEHSGLLEGMGFECKEFGGRSIIVHSVPAAVVDVDPRALVLSVIAALGQAQARDFTELRLEAARAMAACRASVKAGQRLRLEEAAVLLDELRRCKNPRICAHGRPTIISITGDELKRRFGRS